MAAVFEKALQKAREAFFRNVTKDVKFRKQQLSQLLKFFEDNQEKIVEALKADLHKPRMEAIITEVEFCKKDIHYQLENLNDFVKPQYIGKKALGVFLDTCYVKKEPYGVALVIGAWNFPVQLLISPLVGAIAAGNCAIIKPSDVATNVEKLFMEQLPKYLDRDCYHVVTGGVEETTMILKERYDIIFFTGSPAVGKIIYAAAAKHLTPVVLELGGKSPVYLDDSITGSNFETAIRRILWGKLMNSGQVCVAPDYLLCSAQVQEKIAQVAPKILKEFFPSDAKNSESFGRIINKKNFDRLNGLLNSTKGKILEGGQVDGDNCYISPTIVTNVTANDPLMKEELFGPILPIVTVDSIDEAIEFIRRGEKPLTLYVFANKKNVYERFINETSSGSLAVNETILQLSVDDLPFGGVGNSGMGNYHGYHSFNAFSHSKSVYIKNFNPLIEMFASSRYPPHDERKIRLMKRIIARSFLDNIDVGKTFSYLLTFILGTTLTVLVYSLK